jgi:hypothetical protein
MRFIPYPKDDPGKDRGQLASEQAAWEEALAREQAIRAESQAAREAGPARRPRSVADVQKACDDARLSLQLLGRLSRKERYDSNDCHVLGRLSRTEGYDRHDCREPDYRGDFIEPILELWRRVLPRDCPPPLLRDTQPNIEAARSALDLLQAELARLRARQAPPPGPAAGPVPSGLDWGTKPGSKPPGRGAEAVAGDSENFVPVGELWPTRPEFKRASDVTRFLDSLPNEPFPAGIRNQRKGQRRKVHLVDWYRHFTAKDQRTDAALDDEALGDRLADIAARTEQERQRKRRQDHGK